MDAAGGHTPGERTPLGYRPRIIDSEVQRALRSIGAVLIEGPKAAGKTWTAMRFASTVVRVDDPFDSQLREAMNADPRLLLLGDPPVLIDEWQAMPEIWNLVRREVDDRGGAPGQFILTGSSTPDDDVRRHTGAGRFWVLQLRPMSLAESGHSTGEVSLAALLEGKPPRGYEPRWTATRSREEIAERIVVGGWPANVDLPPAEAAENNQRYLRNLAEHDLFRLLGSRRDASTAMKVLRSLARATATPAFDTTIARGAAEVDDDEYANLDTTSRTTVREHAAAFERLRVVEDLPAWNPVLRSSRRARTSPKRHFVDPCLAAAALNTDAVRLAGDPKTLGLWFESLVVRDLRIYAQAARGEVSYLRMSDGLEADAIIELPDGRWGAVEAKLGATPQVVDAAARNLARLAARLDPSRRAFLAVITNGGISHRRDDGVDVIPLRMLGP